MKWMALILFGGLGLAALIGGLVWGGKRYLLSRGGVHIGGTVVENYESLTTVRRDDRSNAREMEVSYYPVVEFTTQQGETIRFRGSTGSAVPDYEVGTPVEVLYDPRNPYGAQMADFSQLWLGPAVVTGAGLIAFIMGVGVFFLIGQADRDMAAAKQSMVQSMLLMKPGAVRINGTIRDVQALDGEDKGRFVFRCYAAVPGSNGQGEFRTEAFNFDPGPEFNGRPVEIILDPYDRNNYYVDLAPLLPEIVKHQRRPSP